MNITYTNIYIFIYIYIWNNTLLLYLMFNTICKKIKYIRYTHKYSNVSLMN